MFLLRSTFWLTLVVLALPPAAGERSALVETVRAARAPAEHVSGPCERRGTACATVRHGMETGAWAGAAQRLPDPVHGTLTAADLVPDWAGPMPRGG